MIYNRQKNKNIHTWAAKRTFLFKKKKECNCNLHVDFMLRFKAVSKCIISV